MAVVAVALFFNPISRPLWGAEDKSESPRPRLMPKTEQLQAVAPSMAEALKKWRQDKHPSRTILLMGPTFVGLENISAHEAHQLASILGQAIDLQLGESFRLLPIALVSPGDVSKASEVYDVRALWEAMDGGRASRLVLEVVNPRDGKVEISFVQSAGGAVTSRAINHEVPPSSGEPQSQPVPDKTAKNSPPPEPPVKAAPVSTPPPAPEKAEAPSVQEPAPATAVPSRGLVRRSPLIIPPADSRNLANPLSLQLTHGMVYFANKRVAERIAILREDQQMLSSGQIRIRFSMMSRKKNCTLQLRCEFYNERGEPAGSVPEVELPVREGRPATIALVSRRTATSYVLFVKD